ncbi:prepilin peptidase [Arthrobacter dokdonensis]|uniref:prepilin peptidase n=1 Tax=Arthrobacter dokdonellae TaxID=2211210 RepID=UPI000DE5AC4D|nr:A24 family peptidase [Arthrobacter dokdonellae]
MSGIDIDWAPAPLWLIMCAAVVGLAAGAYVRSVVATFSHTNRQGQPCPRPTRKLTLALVELATAALFVLTVWRFGANPQLPAYLFFAAAGTALAAIDLRHRLLPNNIVLPGLAITAILLTGAAAAGTTPGTSLLRAVLGAALLFTLYLVLALISPRGLGMGDVKLAAMVGLVLAFQSWQALFTGTFLGFLIGAAVSLVILTIRRGGLKSHIPFGPAILAGAMTALLLS